MLLAASQPWQTQIDASFFGLLFTVLDLCGSTAAVLSMSNARASLIEPAKRALNES